MPALVTGRLRLRPCSLDDVDPLHALCIRPEIRRFLFDDRPITRCEAQALIEFHHKRILAAVFFFGRANGQRFADLNDHTQRPMNACHIRKVLFEAFDCFELAFRGGIAREVVGRVAGKLLCQVDIGKPALSQQAE